MSRNFSSTSCHDCPCTEESIVFDEAPRPVTVEDTHAAYFAECEGMIVAKAHCACCHAQYLAWVKPPTMWGWSAQEHERRSKERFIDLSYRDSFNDEPAVTDLPLFTVVLPPSHDIAIANDVVTVAGRPSQNVAPSRYVAVEHTYLGFAEPQERLDHRRRQADALANGALGPRLVPVGVQFRKALSLFLPTQNAGNLVYLLPDAPATWLVLGDMFEEHGQLPVAAYARDIGARIQKCHPTELTHTEKELKKHEKQGLCLVTGCMNRTDAPNDVCADHTPAKPWSHHE